MPLAALVDDNDALNVAHVIYSAGKTEAIMSVQALCQEAFQDLGVGDLPVEWVNGVWDSNFCDSSSLPEEVEGAVHSTGKWNAVLSACRQWLSRDPEEDNDGKRIRFQSLFDSPIFSSSPTSCNL